MCRRYNSYYAFCLLILGTFTCLYSIFRKYIMRTRKESSERRMAAQFALWKAENTTPIGESFLLPPPYTVDVEWKNRKSPALALLLLKKRKERGKKKKAQKPAYIQFVDSVGVERRTLRNNHCHLSEKVKQFCECAGVLHWYNEHTHVLKSRKLSRQTEEFCWFFAFFV